MKKKSIGEIVLIAMLLLSACGQVSAPPTQATSTPIAEQTKPSEKTENTNLDLSDEEEATNQDNVSTRDNVGSQIYVRKDTDGTDDGLASVLAMMEENGEPFYQTADSLAGLIANDDVVILFYNGQWDERGGTNTDLINAIVEAIATHPDGFNGEIVIADSGQGDGALDHAKANSANRDQSIMDVVNKQKELGVKVTGYLWDDIMNIEVSEFTQGDDNDGYVIDPEVSQETQIVISYPKFTTEYGTQISIREGIWDGTNYDSDTLKLINIPVLKSHWLYRGTACVKNYMGMPSQNLSKKAGGDPHLSVALGSMGEMMAKSRMSVLNILDMIYIGAYGGPWLTYEEASDNFMIAASTDPFALDYWAVKNILMPKAEEVGNSNWQAMDPDGDTPGTFGHWMSLSLEEIQKYGYNDFVFGSEGVVIHER